MVGISIFRFGFDVKVNLVPNDMVGDISVPKCAASGIVKISFWLVVYWYNTLNMKNPQPKIKKSLSDGIWFPG